MLNSKKKGLQFFLQEFKLVIELIEANMDTGREHRETTKLLMEQKTLFCNILLLEIEKYEQSLNKLNKSSLKNKAEKSSDNYNITIQEDTKHDGINGDDEDNEVKWTGFQSLDEVEVFGREYYHGVLHAITKNLIFDINSPFPNKYLDLNVSITVNGVTTNGLLDWIKYHNSGMNHIKQCYMADWHIESWIPYSFAAKYTISVIFSNGQKCVNHGTVSIMMSKKEKKIMTAISTSDNDSYLNMIQSMPRPK